ncbi:MAG: hypothetical protein HC922_00595 [Leptolyngbyaceae cyanobacterium SM2_3_12]|nr:hypothetical protein [Leptolyngbyaceae cyanobacterium SM2_3_12]
MAIALAMMPMSPSASPVLANTPMPPSSAEVCAIVAAMPGTEDTDALLAMLDSSRTQVLDDLNAMGDNMERYDAENYGWQNVIDDSSALEPRPGAWMIGALRMACEPQPAATVSGTVSYPQRIALPPNATVVVKLEDVSLADAPSTVIAEQRITTAGQSVPIPFKLVYDPADIEAGNRYVVRAQIFYDDELRWTSTTSYPVITQNNPNRVEIAVDQV